MARGDLKAAVLDALNRQDLSAQADAWIMGAHTRINTMLRHRQMLKHKVLAVNSRVFAAPADFIEADSAQINNAPAGSLIQPGAARTPLMYAPPAEITGAAAMASMQCRVPQFFTMHGLQFELAPWTDNGPFQMDLWYYARIPLGPDATASNFFLDQYPHVYLNGVMTFGHRFLLEPDAALGYEALFASEIGTINDSEAEAKIGRGPLVMPRVGRPITSRRLR